MPTKRFVYNSTPETQLFPYIPQPPDYGVLTYLTSCGHEYLKKGYLVDREGLDIYMVNYVVNGSGTIVYDGKTYKLKKGSLCMIYLGNSNLFYSTSDMLEIYYFHFKGANLKEYYKQITNGSNHVFEGFNQEIIEKSFDKVKEQLCNEKSYFEISKICSALLTDILEFSITNTQEVYPAVIFKTLITIRDLSNITASDVAKAVGFNPIYLERIFKKHTGESLKHAITTRNLEIAQNMLLTTDLSIADIAEKLGYTNSNGLIILFKKHLGVTPLEYKKKNKR